MYGVKSSQVMFPTTFNHLDGEFPKNKEPMNSDLYQNLLQQQSSGLTRYRSAPSSFFASLLEDDFLNQQSSSSESESMFARLIGDSDTHDLEFPAAAKLEKVESDLERSNGYFGDSTQMTYQTTMQNHDSVSAHTSFSSSYKVNNSRPMENPVRLETSGGNCSNLMRQSSSPAEFFSNLTVENGVAVMRDTGNFGVGNGTKGETNPSTSRFSDHINFSTGTASCSRFMPRIAENDNETTGTAGPENGHLRHCNGNNGSYVPGFPNDSWNDSAFGSLKRKRDDDVKMFSTFNALDTANEDCKNYTPGLVHHLSLPKTSAEMAAVEKYVQFQQDQTPCKIRAKRGFATHPRSIAERVRRTRISERIRKLQDLFPNMDKQTNTAEMLDLAVEYIKDLQKVVKTLTDTREKCTCSSKQKHHNPTA